MTTLDEDMLRIRVAEAAVLAAQDAMGDVVFDVLENAARRHDLDEMLFAHETVLKRGGVEIQIDEIEALESFYRDYVNESGFLGQWSKAKGWYDEH